MSEPIQVLRPGQSPSAPFGRVGIVGVGLLGGSVALSARRRWPSALIIGVDGREVIERATVAHAIDVGADDLGMISDADLIVLAAPVSENVRLLAEIPRFVTRAATITDVGSTKREIVAAARHLPAHLTFVGGHPIAGAAVGGFQHARPDLFQGRPWILCAESGEVLSALRQFVAGLGANPVEMPAGDHDRVMAFLSHLPQLAASALMHTVAQNASEEWLPLAGQGFHDSTRLASSPARMWKDVAASNADELRPALDALIQTLEQLRDDLSRGEALEEIFRSAQEWKSKLERS